MYDIIKRLWSNRSNNGMTINSLQTALARNWITAEQYAVILVN